jgi:hypothetical protein
MDGAKHRQNMGGTPMLRQTHRLNARATPLTFFA